jgi:hypothetical protein
LLREGRRADVEVLRHAFDCRHERLRYNAPAKSPTSHAEIFREAVDDDGVRIECERGLRRASLVVVIAKIQIDFIDDAPRVAGSREIAQSA